ncbi:MAG: hypothetical protein DRI80_09625 [Chloroflexota bacterium]|nr:MAG: hypothetical protein DRI80_09625 [Chloroflexota bacterium]
MGESKMVARLQRSFFSLIAIVTGLIGPMMIICAGRAERMEISLAAPPCPGDYAPGIVLVGLRSDTSHAQRNSLLSRWTVAADMPVIGVAAIHAPVGMECAVLETLQQDPRVAFAELDYAAHATDVFIPNDPDWPRQWGPTQIGAPSAWTVTTGTASIVIAIVDSGIRLNHEDLAANLWNNPGETPGNGIDDDGNGQVDDTWGWHFYHQWAWNGEEYTYMPAENNQVADDNGHGSHVAGIAGAGIDNETGIAGIAGNARLMTVKVLDEYGSGWYSDIAQGIIYAVDNGARVINLSLGGRESSQTLQEAMNYAHTHGVLTVAAAGNRDTTDGYDAVLYPAACEHVLAVAATDRDDLRPSFSNHGPQVDVAAPGVEIYSTWYRGNYFTRSGTSMAAPHVSGLAALIWSARPHLSASRVGGIITTTTFDVNSGTLQLPGWDEYIGWGRIDAARALAETIQTPLPKYHYLPLILRRRATPICLEPPPCVGLWTK